IAGRFGGGGQVGSRGDPRPHWPGHPGYQDAHANHSHRFRSRRRPRRKRTGEQRCQAGGQHHWLYQHFPTLGGKWLALLKEVGPPITRVAILFNPDPFRGGSMVPTIESAATQLGATTARAPFRNSAEIEGAVEAFATEPNGALILVGAFPEAAEFGTIQCL